MTRDEIVPKLAGLIEATELMNGMHEEAIAKDCATFMDDLRNYSSRAYQDSHGRQTALVYSMAGTQKATIKQLRALLDTIEQKEDA